MMHIGKCSKEKYSGGSTRISNNQKRRKETAQKEKEGI
jgi:hypothetical protein